MVLGVKLLIIKPTGTPNVFVGMDIGYGDEEVALKLIDKVADYVNLIIFQVLVISYYIFKHPPPFFSSID